MDINISAAATVKQAKDNMENSDKEWKMAYLLRSHTQIITTVVAELACLASF